MARLPIEAVFFDRRSRRCETVFFPLPTGVSGSAPAAKIRCNDYAWDNAFTHWAHYDIVGGRWLVFECQGRSTRVFLGEKPTREAAEMWLIHLG